MLSSLFSVLVSGVHVGSFPLMSDNHCSHKINTEAVKTDRQFGHCGSFSTYANQAGLFHWGTPQGQHLWEFSQRSLQSLVLNIFMWLIVISEPQNSMCKCAVEPLLLKPEACSLERIKQCLDQRCQAQSKLEKQFLKEVVQLHICTWNSEAH